MFRLEQEVSNPTSDHSSVNLDNNTDNIPWLMMRRVVNRIGRPFGINPFPRAFTNQSTANLVKRDDIFQRIFAENFWGSSESVSGAGSEMKAASSYALRLSKTLTRNRMSRLFDAPCGDLNWILPLIRENAFAYQGGDICSGLITKLKANFPDVSVKRFDICTDVFDPTDVWHCRDCLFHLPFIDIRQAFERFAESEIPFAMLTTHKARWLHKNLDVAAGGFRFLDLERAPISLPPAVEYVVDYKRGRDFPRYVGLWHRQNIIDALTRWPA